MHLEIHLTVSYRVRGERLAIQHIHSKKIWNIVLNNVYCEEYRSHSWWRIYR